MKQLKKEIIYNFKWQLIFNHKYKVTDCMKIINIDTGNIIKETVVGYTCGFWIGRKFIAKKRLNDYCEKIETLSLKKLKDISPTIYN